MDEISYTLALELGIDITSYRQETLQELPEGRYEGLLMALVWGRYGAPAHLNALVELDIGEKVRIAAYANNKRKKNYGGLRELTPYCDVMLEISRGPRGGLITSLVEIDENGLPVLGDRK